MTIQKYSIFHTHSKCNGGLQPDNSGEWMKFADCMDINARAEKAETERDEALHYQFESISEKSELRIRAEKDELALSMTVFLRDRLKKR